MNPQNLDRAFSSARADTKLQAIIEDCVRRSSFQRNWVTGQKFNHQSGVSPAFGFGMRFPSLFGYPEFPIGAIFVSDSFCNYFPEKELEFIVLHELGHIVNNHSIGNLIVYGAKEIFVSWLSQEIKTSKDAIRNGIGLLKWIVYALSGQGTIEELITRQMELDADKYGVLHQREKGPAMSVLTKITNGNMDVPTHLTTDGVFVTPVVTARERIDAIRNLII